ncbi:hypothetical protein PYW08_013504 [Mythimna loreyi]|uniref:Uncharacterized protein n=1 Tax=Mythimna loreyi TaxID=667449 RepID=A0ACC2QKU1_9NEOP|nr:hypothetical protein PYW08_013504 [Mythimna loreyi]
MQWLTTADGKYRVESLSAATIPGALKLMKEHFFQDEPVCNGTEVNKNPLAIEELLELCADAALDGLSLVAIDVKSGEVVSAIFNKLQEAPSNSSEKTFFEIFSEERCKQPSSRALVNLMVELDAQCDIANRYGVDCWCELMFLGTHRQQRGKGLGKLLCQTSIEAAKRLKDGPFAPMTIEELGPKYSFMKPRTTVVKVPKLCTSLLTSIGTQKIAKALGFTVLITVPFNDFIFDGKPYSKRGVDAFCEGVAKRIDFHLQSKV